MPIDLESTINPIAPTPDQAALLADLQGNILDGHGRRSTINLFIRFEADEQAARACVQAIADLVTSAARQLEEAARFRETGESGKTFIGFLLSRSGYTALGLDDAVVPRPVHKDDTVFSFFGDDTAFEEGMLARAAHLGDREALIEAPYLDRIDAMILIGGNPNSATSWLSDEVAAMETQIAALLQNAAVVVTREVGRAIFRGEAGLEVGTPDKVEGIEHFGYVDGRSQPLMLTSLLDRERDETDGISVWDPKFPISQVLVADPASPDASLGTAFGSFFVFRKLEQNVAGFKKAEADLGAELGIGELAGAMLVGRFEDGTPVVLQHEEGSSSPVLNNFDYQGDPAGLRCPHFSHIRKTNPRTPKQANGSDKRERRHIMARRGMTYGTRNSVMNPSDEPDGGVGLMFMSFQNNLTQQFEFTQAAWANNPNFEVNGAGLDPVIGQAGNGTVQQLDVPKAWGKPGTRSLSFAEHVTFRGGGYFFAPAISTLKSLG